MKIFLPDVESGFFLESRRIFYVQRFMEKPRETR